MASARGSRRVVGWLSETMTAVVAAPLASPGWLAGTDHDAEVRAVLRCTAPATAWPGSELCAACLAAGRSETGCLAEILRASGGDQPDRRLLCGGHLNDLVVLAGQRAASSLLAWQAGCLAASPAWRPASPPVPARRLLRSRRPRAGGPARCPVCLAAGNAAQRAVDGLRASLRASHPAPGRRAPLCVRHLLNLRALDPRAGQVTARGAAEHADMLIAELAEAFSKNTWARRHETRGPEMTAWRRAAAFLDGGVFCGCVTRET
jgi:hypothetical protein